jgi:uncharacterized membrane protein
MTEFSKLLHLFAALWWLGGMGVMIYAVRPAVLAQLDSAPRLKLMAAILQRFFMGVWISVVVILASGLHLYGAGAMAASQARKIVVAAGGTPSASLLPLGWNLMLGIGALMMLIFAHIHFAGFRKMHKALGAGDNPGAAAALAKMHPFILANFGLGLLAVAAVKLLR